MSVQGYKFGADQFGDFQMLVGVPAWKLHKKFIIFVVLYRESSVGRIWGRVLVPREIGLFKEGTWDLVGLVIVEQAPADW